MKTNESTKKKLEFNFNETQLKKELIKEMAKQMLSNSRGISFLGNEYEVKEVFRKKTIELLNKDKKFNKEIVSEIKKVLKNKRVLSSVAREILKEKLEESDY